MTNQTTPERKYEIRIIDSNTGRQIYEGINVSIEEIEVIINKIKSK